MSEELKKTDITNELARERNRVAADRTLMAWIRTTLATISFGFGVSKVYYVLDDNNPEQFYEPIHSAQIVGEALIALGILGHLASVFQHWKILKQIFCFRFS